MSMKNPLTPAGIEPETFRFVARHLNHCATAVPTYVGWYLIILNVKKLTSYELSRGALGSLCKCEKTVAGCIYAERVLGHLND